MQNTAWGMAVLSPFCGVEDAAGGNQESERTERGQSPLAVPPTSTSKVASFYGVAVLVETHKWPNQKDFSKKIGAGWAIIVICAAEGCAWNEMANKRKRRTSNEKLTTAQKNIFAKNSSLAVSVIVAAVIVFVLFLAIASTAGTRTAAPAGEKVAQYTVPSVQKTAEPATTAPALTPTAAPVVAEKLPDLQLQLFSTYSGETKQAIRITTDVFNKGDGDITTNYKVTYGYVQKIGTNRVDYVQVGDAEVKGPHKSGITRTFAFLWAPEKTGTYDFKVCADYGGEIKESNEENNCATSTITVRDFAKYQ